jgi:hypothetical protein
MILVPNSGNTETNRGNMAQWIAQANEVVIPRASQFIFDFIKTAKIGKSNVVAKSI